MNEHQMLQTRKILSRLINGTCDEQRSFYKRLNLDFDARIAFCEYLKIIGSDYLKANGDIKDWYFQYLQYLVRHICRYDQNIEWAAMVLKVRDCRFDPMSGGWYNQKGQYLGDDPITALEKYRGLP